MQPTTVADVTATTTRTQSATPAVVVIGVVSTAVLLVAAFGWAWAASSPWDRPVAPIVLVVLAWVSYAFAAAASRRHGDVRWAAPRLIGYAAVGAATVALVCMVGSGTFSRMRAAALTSELEPAAHWYLASAEESSDECGPGALDVDHGSLGVPDEVCVDVHDDAQLGPVRTVQFAWGSRLLVYDDVAPRHPPWSRCRLDLRGGWAAEAEEDPSCPPGFAFVGAP